MKKILFTTGLVFAVVFLFALTGCASAATASPTPTMQKTSTATASPQPHYTLQRPDFQQLLSLIPDVRDAYQKNEYVETWEQEILFYGSSHMDKLIAEDLKKYDAESIPNAGQYIENVPAEWDDMFSLPTASIQEILFHHSAIDLFNQKQVRFADKQAPSSFSSFPATAYALDADGKTWLVQVDLPKQNIIYWLTLREDASGKYQIIPNNIATDHLDTSNFSTKIISTNVDINNDGKNDIVKLASYYFAGGLSKTLFIYSQNDDGISLLAAVHFPSVTPVAAEAHESEYTIGDHNGDGLLDIQITTPRFAIFDCSWEQKLIVQFEGEKRTNQTINGEIPDKPECFLAKSTRSDDPQVVASLVRSARANLKQDASVDLRTWVQLRLAMADSAQGKDAQALQELAAIQKLPQGTGSFQKVVLDAYQQAGSSPLRLCEILNVRSIQKNQDDKDFDTDIDVDLADLGAYPLDMTPVASIVCPFRWLVNQRLARQAPGKYPSPDKAFAAVGLQLTSFHQANLDDDADPEWIGLLGTESAGTVFLDQVDGKWRITDEYFQAGWPSDLSVEMQDVTGDGRPDVLLSFAYRGNASEKCSAGKASYRLQILDTSISDEYQRTVFGEDFECAAQSPLKTLSIQDVIGLMKEAENTDDLGRTYPDWAKYQAGKGEDDRATDLLDDVDDVENLVLANDQPQETQNKIKTILASMPENDPAADALRERLLYLSGYSYELQGDDEKALVVYLALIEKNPQSLWSRLAQSRIATK